MSDLLAGSARGSAGGQVSRLMYWQLHSVALQGRQLVRPVPHSPGPQSHTHQKQKLLIGTGVALSVQDARWICDRSADSNAAACLQ